MSIKLEVRKQEAGNRKQEAGSRKQEAGSRKQETGNRKLEKTQLTDRNQLTEFCLIHLAHLLLAT